VYALGNQAQLTGVVTVGTGLNSAQTTPTAGAATLLLLTAPSLDEFAVTFAGIAVNEQCDEASSVRNKLIAATKKASQASLQGYLLANRGVDLLSQTVSTLNLPVLVTQGTHDGMVFPGAGLVLRNAINTGKEGGSGVTNPANAALYELRNRGHAPFLTDACAWNAAVQYWIEAQECRTCGRG